MVEYEQVEFTSAPRLRAWLAEHHDSVRGIWAVTYKRSAGERHLTYEALVREALCYGWIDGQARGVDESRTSLLLTPRRPGSGWSRPNKIRIAELEAGRPARARRHRCHRGGQGLGELDHPRLRRGRDRAARTRVRPGCRPSRPAALGCLSQVGAPGRTGVGRHRQAGRDPGQTGRRDRPALSAE